MYGNPAALSQLERERLGIPPQHHVGLDPNDPMQMRLAGEYHAHSHTHLHLHSQQQQQEAAYQLAREFVLKNLIRRYTFI